MLECRHILLSPATNQPSIIGRTMFHFSVRNGKRWDTFEQITSKCNASCFKNDARKSKKPFWHTTPPKGSVLLKKTMFEWTISTSRLNALLRVHLTPINLVIFQGPKTPHLGKGFVLRCFQRLSLPNIATQQFTWWQSWQTRGSFNPVLSYQGQPPSSINACSRQRPTCLTHVFTYFYVHWTIFSSAIQGLF